MSLGNTINASASFQELPGLVLVVGAGYVGLTTAVCLSSLGNKVVCVDIDVAKIESINAGVLPIYEPGLSELLKKSVDQNLLEFSTDLNVNASIANFIFLCLPTPPLEDGTADLSFIFQVTDSILPHLKDNAVIVNKSTVPLNTAAMIKSRQQNDCVSVVSNPEFLREGSAVSDFLDPSRIVIGADDNEAANKVASLYKGLQDRMFFTDPISAECIKYMSNGFLAMKISFINQVARFCDAVGADVISVANGISLDPRIGNSFLSPGPGWGGSCFPKDTDALSAAARYVGSPLSLIEESVRDNRTHQTEIAKLAIDVINGIPQKRPKIAALGLSFKANTDDVRVSPAIKIIQLIAQRTQNCEIFAYDPQANCAQNDIFTRVSSLDEAIDGADVAIILTEWQEFAEISPAMLAKKMRGKNIIDTRYIIPKSAFEQFGIQVFSIGRK